MWRPRPNPLRVGRSSTTRYDPGDRRAGRRRSDRGPMGAVAGSLRSELRKELPAFTGNPVPRGVPLVIPVEDAGPRRIAGHAPFEVDARMGTAIRDRHVPRRAAIHLVEVVDLRHAEVRVRTGAVGGPVGGGVRSGFVVLQ